MSIESSQVTVGLSPTIIAFNGDSGNAASIRLKNAGGTSNIYLGGGTTLASTTGLLWGTTEPAFTTNLEAGEALYGITAAGTTSIHVLKQSAG